MGKFRKLGPGLIKLPRGSVMLKNPTTERHSKLKCLLIIKVFFPPADSRLSWFISLNHNIHI